MERILGRTGTIVLYVILGIAAALCLYPLIYVLALSFSSPAAAAAGKVKLWPVDFTVASYQYAMSRVEFIRALGISVLRVVLGVTLNLVLTVLIAYPLSKEVSEFRWRTHYAWFFVITMLFSGGLIPLYMTVRATGLLNTIWALVLPTAVPVFNVVLMLNFFRALPRELSEAALVDGASHWSILLRVYLPLSKAALATVGLLSLVFQWNSWFDGLIFMNQTNYPLQSYLKTLVIDQGLLTGGMTVEQAELIRKISDRTFTAAQVMLAAVPVVMVYPFLQKHLAKGLVLGSVKE